MWWKKELAYPALWKSQILKRGDIPMEKGYHKGKELIALQLGLSM